MSKNTSYMKTPEFREAVRQGNLRRYALHPMSVETKAKISNSNKGKIRPPEWGQHISEAKKGTPSPMKGKPQPSSSYTRSEETKHRMSEGRKKMLAEHPELIQIVVDRHTNKIVFDETKKKQSAIKKKYFEEHPEAHEFMSKINKGTTKKSDTRSKTYKKKWRDPEYVAMMMQARNYKPNKQEARLGEILEELFPNHFKYNGDGSLGVTLNGYIPDFVNVNGKKQVIELFGTYWHSQDGRGEEDRLSRYAEIGWNCLVIWDKELKELDTLKNKIKVFVGGFVDE